MPQITLPNNFSPRPYQNALMGAMDRGVKRACAVWHRRAGKDAVAIHQTSKMAHQRKGLYWHMLPTQRQARKVVWDSFTKSGERLIDQAFPRELRKGDPNNTEMKIPLRCGSLWQLVGSDNYDALVGSNPIGVVFSEWSLTDPRILDYVRPILLENDGWAIFIYTPRGYNHGHDIKVIAEANPDDWFYSLKTVDDTKVVSRADIEKEMRDGMPEELVQQEFYCSFSAANVGAILGGRIEAAEREGRITQEQLWVEAGGPIIAACDIGFRDAAAFWFWQLDKTGANLIHYMEESGMEAQDWIVELRKLPFILDTLYLPHDARAKTFAVKHSALEQFLESKLCSIKVLPRVAIADRINAARAVAPHCRWYKPACARGLAALREWQFEWDDRRKLFSKDPDHNWASHGGDAFSYGSLVLLERVREWNDIRARTKPEAKKPEVKGANYAFNLEDLHQAEEDFRNMGERI